jgi:hypothetical protein
MSETDRSRERALYHLLLTVIRKLNAPISPEKKLISNELKTLQVIKEEGKFKIFLGEGQNLRKVEILVSDVKFYDTKNDPTIAKKNLQIATEIATKLLPSLNQERYVTKKRKEFQTLDSIFIAYFLGIVYFSFSDGKNASTYLVSIFLCFIPFWNFSSNFHILSRWLGSLVYSATYVLYFHNQEEPDRTIIIFLGLSLASYLLKYLTNGPRRKWPTFLMVIAFVSLAFNDFYSIIFFTCLFLLLEKILVLVFKRNKHYGLSLYFVLSLGLVLFVVVEFLGINSLNVYKLLQAVIIILLSYSYLVGATQMGAIRLAIPALATLLIAPQKSFLFIITGVGILTIFKVFSRILDRRNYVKI